MNSQREKNYDTCLTCGGAIDFPGPSAPGMNYYQVNWCNCQRVQISEKMLMTLIRKYESLREKGQK